MYKTTKALGLLLFFSMLCQTIYGQFIIENPSGTLNTPPTAQDVNICFPVQGNLEFRLIAQGASSDPVLEVDLANGREYVDGSITIIDQSGGYTVGPNVGTATDPEFIINGSFTTGDYVQIRLQKVGTCDAQSMNGLSDVITVGGASESSSNHDALSLTLSSSPGPAVQTVIGGMETLTGTITGGGNGCAQEIVLAVMDNQGLNTTAVRVEGNSLTADSVSMDGVTTYYTISTPEILQVGDNDNCLESNETLNFERDVTITDCNIDASYLARWGCNSEVCFSTPTRLHDISIQLGIPNVTGTANVNNLDIFCTDITINNSFTFTNNGTEPQSGAGTAFNVSPTIGWDWVRPVDPYRLGNTPFTNFTINGMAVPAAIISAPGYNLDLSLLPPGLDIDGPGGLQDLDNDGVFDDLAIGDSFTIDFDIQHPGTCNTNCSGSYSYRRPAWKVDFDDQCSSRPPTQNLALPSVFFRGRGNRVTSTGPADIDDNQTGNFCFSYSHPMGGIVRHPEDSIKLTLTLPDGFMLASPSNATIDGDPSLVLSATQTGNEVVVSTTQNNLNREICVDLTLNCATTTPQAATIDWNVAYVFANSSGVCCTQQIACQSISLATHCPTTGCMGPRTVAFEADRTTFGYTDATMTTKATSGRLDMVYKSDSFQITVPGYVNSELDRAWVDIKYGNVNGTNPFDFLRGEFEIYDNSSGMTTLCSIDMSAATVTNTGGNNFNMRFSATDLIGTCLPAGFTWNTGDSINLVADLRFNGAGHNGARYEFPNFRAIHGGISPGSTVERTCDSYGKRFYGASPYINTNSTNTISISGCEVIEVRHSRTAISSSSFDDFIGEYRPTARIDSVISILPEGITYIPGSSLYQFRAEPGRTIYSVDVSDPIITPLGNGTVKYTFINTGDFIPSDKVDNSSCCISMLLTADFQAGCNLAEGSYSIIDSTYVTDIFWDLSEECHTPRVLTQTHNFNYTSPSFSMMPTVQNQIITTQETEWQVEVCNTSTANNSPFNWLNFNSASGNIVVDSVKYQKYDIGNNPIGGEVNAPVSSPACPNSDYFAEIGDLQQGECVRANIFATLNSCETDTLLFNSGWDCIGYPVSTCNLQCTESDSLFVVPLDAQVQIELNQQASPFDPCSMIMDTVIITSAQASYITDLLLCIPLPEGLREDDNMVTIEYPENSGNFESHPATIVSGSLRDTLYVDMNSHSVIRDQNGIPGTEDASNAQETRAKIIITWLTDCELTTGTTYDAVIYANSFCGDPAADNGVGTQSDPIIVNSSNPPYLSVINTDMVPDTTYGCEAQTVDISVSIYAGETSPRDSIHILLPVDNDYVAGSFNCTTTMPAYCPSLGATRQVGDRQLLVFKIPQGISVPSGQSTVDLNFSFDMEPQVSAPCNAWGEIDLNLISVISGVYCPTTMATCPNISLTVGNAQDSIFFRRSVVSLKEAEICIDRFNQFYILGSVKVDSLPIPYGESLFIDVHCENYRSRAIQTIAIPGPIDTTSTVEFSSRILTNRCNPGDDINLSLGNDNGNCVCIGFDSLISVTPQLIVEAGSSPSICRLDNLDLTSIGASITGPISTGTWTTSGDGTFDDGNGEFGVATTYLHGPQDIANGEFTLTLTSDDPLTNCGVISDNITVRILNVNCGTYPWNGGN